MISAIPLLFALQAPPSATAESEAADVLKQPRYAFCHDPEYPLTHWEHQWCPITGDHQDCPQFVHACKGQPIENPAPAVQRSSKAKRRRTAGRSGNRREDADSPGGGTGKTDGAPRRRPPESPDQGQITVAPGMSLFARIIFIAVLAAGVIAVARAIFKNLLRDGDDGDTSEDESAPEAAPIVELAKQGPVETDVARLLARARAAAARGQYDEAIQDAYAALLRRLEGSGLIDIHPSRTNGDYVRDLRDRPDLKTPVHEIFRDVERVHFGAETASPGLFQSVFDRVVALAGQTLAVVLLCGGLGMTISCASGTPSSKSEWVGSEDTSPSGMAAVLELLNSRGIKARYRHRPLDDLTEEDRTLVLMPGLDIDDATWDHIFDWFDRTHSTLVIAGLKPVPARIRAVPLELTGKSSTLLVEESYHGILGDLTLAVLSDRALLLQGDVEPLLYRNEDVGFLEDGEAIPTLPYAAFHRSNLGRVVVFADDSLFANIALVPADNAAFLVNLFTYLGNDVEFCDASTGSGADTPLDSIERARLTPIIVQLMVLLALLFLSKGIAFGKLRDPPAVRRRAFSEHARVLGVHYERAHASKHVLGHYASWAIERLRERMQRGSRRGLSALAEAIATRARMPESEVMRILVDAQSAQDESAPPSFRPSHRGALLGVREPPQPQASRDLALMRELDRFLTMTRGGEPSRKHKPMGPT